MIHANSLRNVELMRSVSQAEVVRDTRAVQVHRLCWTRKPLGSHMQKRQCKIQLRCSNINGGRYKRERQFKARELLAKALIALSIITRGKEAIIEPFNANQGLRERQYDRSQTARIAKYISQYNSQQYYEQADVFDPIAPFPPLPTMMLPPAPSMRGRASAGAAILSGAGAVLGGINAAYGMQAQIDQITAPTPDGGPN